MPQNESAAKPGGSAIAEEYGEENASRISVEERELWDRWRSREDQSARETLIDRYQDLVRIIAAAIYRTANYGYIEFRDLFQLGMIGLLEAISRFDPGLGPSFESYARKRIRGAILNGLETLSESHAQSAFRKRIRKERAQSFAENAQSEHVSNPFQQMIEIATGLAVGHMLEGTAMYVDSSPERSAYDDSSAVLSSAQSMRYLIGALPAQEAKVLERHYLGGIAFDEIAKLMGLSKGRISQLHSKAVAGLRARYRERGSLDLSA